MLKYIVRNFREVLAVKIIGITGQSGSGKGTLSAEFAKLGYVHADADKIYHDLLKSNASLKEELASEFGRDVLKDGEIDRNALGKKVFGKKNARKLLRLNKITHRYVCREYIKLIMSLNEQGAKGLVIDAPLLIEARLNNLCDTVILVVCDREKRIERIIKRDGISREAAELRINSQKDLSFYAKFCDRIFISGSDSEEDTAKRIIEELHEETV